MSLRVTILGCGSSAGVPRVSVGWGACDPDEPKNHRRRCSLLVEKTGPGGVTRVLVDTGPDLRMQLLGAGVPHLDGVFYTHDHADHTNGIDDLRPLAIEQRRRIDVYMDERTSGELRQRFSYCFETPPGSEYPPILREHRIAAGVYVQVEGQGGTLTALPIKLRHGSMESLGFRFDDIAYCCDVSDIPAEEYRHFSGLDVWIVDALRYRPHSSHFTVEEALGWIAKFAPRRAILTNLHLDLDYQTLKRQLPPHVEPAFDGMIIKCN